jgi:hypothetical protein
LAVGLDLIQEESYKLMALVGKGVRLVRSVSGIDVRGHAWAAAGSNEKSSFGS